eukprot:UN03278
MPHTQKKQASKYNLNGIVIINEVCHENKILETEKNGPISNGTAIKHSCLRSDTNPFTIARKAKLKQGHPLMVQFDEKIVVHTVPHWDRSFAEKCIKKHKHKDSNKKMKKN